MPTPIKVSMSKRFSEEIVRLVENYICYARILNGLVRLPFETKKDKLFLKIFYEG